MNHKLATAIKEAADKLAQQKPPTADPVAIGDEFVLPVKTDITLSWLVVNFHPDDKSLALVVPTDDAPFFGVCDVKGEPPRIARTGFSEWTSVQSLPIANRVDYGLTDWAKACRVVLAGLARGKPPQSTPEQEACEADPNYEHHCADIEAACAQVR